MRKFAARRSGLNVYVFVHSEQLGRVWIGIGYAAPKRLVQKFSISADAVDERVEGRRQSLRLGEGGLRVSIGKQQHGRAFEVQSIIVGAPTLDLNALCGCVRIGLRGQRLQREG